MGGEKEKILNRKYFIIDKTRALSSGDLSCDTTRGRLKVKNVNDKWVQIWWYEKCWLEKGEENNKITLSHARNVSKKM